MLSLCGAVERSLQNETLASDEGKTVIGLPLVYTLVNTYLNPRIGDAEKGKKHGTGSRRFA